jgi:hypothetical protein
MAMTANDLWRLHDELTVEEAARLVVEEIVDSSSSEYNTHVRIVEEALSRAVARKEIEFRAEHHQETGFNGAVENEYDTIYLSVSSLKSWFAKRGARPSFFFPDTVDAPDYLNPDHPRYAAKLAAAVTAWMNVGEVPGTSPKQALVRWLRENASRFGLTDSEGLPITKGVDDIATVANWSPKGGAPKTPGGTSEE